VVEGAEISHSDILVVYLPKSKDYSNERILNIIEPQNEGINSRNWRVLRRNSNGATVELTISAGPQPVEILKAADFRANYKFGLIQFRPRGSRSGTRKPSGKGEETTKPPNSTNASKSDPPQFKGKQVPLRQGNIVPKNGKGPEDVASQCHDT